MVKIRSSLSKYLDIILVVLQGSVLKSISFNVFITDLLISINEVDICNFADNTTLHKWGKDLQLVSQKIGNGR